ncbi:MAG: Gfo/Idh/MocA family oxidoreductase [Planctomycetota bacterium]|nr:Gfo/Idh/MocA family oxidoreductase [Planctomycetota bacterium]
MQKKKLVPSKVEGSNLSRRAFLKRTAALAAVPCIVPATVLGRNGAVPASERIVLGGIGIGNRGQHDLKWMLKESDVQFVATCDPQRKRAEEVKKIVDTWYSNKDCKIYHSTPEFLAERTDIDAMLVTTGDRWHALASIMAMRAGKDVYSEKPSSMTIAEGRAVVETAKRYRRIYQTGTQRLSEGDFTFCNEMLRTGRLGKVHTVRAHIAPWDAAEMRHDWLEAEPLPPKEEVDWDAWLGPCPWRPYNSTYVRGGWRGYFDFDSGATLLDWGAHTVDLCQWANDADGTTPVTYEPDGGTIYARYANGVKLVMRPGGWMGLGSCPVRFEGDAGWVETGDSGRIEFHPASLAGERRRFVQRGTDPAGHTRNFFDCVKSRSRTAANANVMRSSHIACHAAAIAWMLGRKVTFDPAREAFVGDDEANAMCTRALRSPWHI